MRRLRRHLWLILIFVAPACLAAGPAERLAARVKKQGEFYSVKFGGYVIKSNVDAQFTAEAALYMRKFHVTFRKFFKPKPKVKTTPVVYLFKDRASYQDYVKKEFKSDTLVKAGGFYSGRPGKSELFCWHNRPGKGFAAFPRTVMQHEGAHQLLSYILGTRRIPIWFNEGVATFFESWKVNDDYDANIARLRRTHGRFHIIKKAFGTDKFYDLAYLVKLDYKSWVPDKFGSKTTMHYAEVESFMTFLMVSKQGRKFFAKIFVAVAKGKNVSRMLSARTIRSAQKAWYADIQGRINPTKKTPAAVKKE
jgi:hypothetical protein